ncbi:MAG: hypothetical protein LBR11_02790 [Deltaproteobacteria bacterium]|jgi:hypothetical protein|nr:hypothetical protein [Deltaproteobacteria bacterium]
MAINICTRKDIKLDAKYPNCHWADQCCWYETTTDQSSACHNRNTLVCQRRREEVFGWANDSEESRVAL